MSKAPSWMRRVAGRPYRAWRIVHRPSDNHPEPLRRPDPTVRRHARADVLQYATGSFTGNHGGGLGLLITGDRERDGYGQHPVQTRYVPAFATTHQTTRGSRQS
jgi:hypothetical protein